MRRLALRGLRVPWVAPLTAQVLARDGLRVHLRWCAPGFDARCGLRVLLQGWQQALELSGAQRGVTEIEFAAVRRRLVPPARMRAARCRISGSSMP